MMEYEVVDGIRVKVEYDDCGLFFLSSPDEKGVLIAQPTREAAIAEVPKVRAALKAAKEWWDGMSEEEKQTWNEAME